MRLWRRYGARLLVEHEDALAELVGEAWPLHRDRGDPERNPSFASAVSWKLGCFGVDRFLRTPLGRKGEKIPPGGYIESLDGPGQQPEDAYTDEVGSGHGRADASKSRSNASEVSCPSGRSI